MDGRRTAFYDTTAMNRSLLLLLLGCCLCHGTLVATHAADNQRILWTSSRLHGTPDPPLPYTTERVYRAQRFNQPTYARVVPSTDWILVSDTTAKIHAFRHDNDAKFETILDLSTKELDPNGIRDFTFHPGFPEQPWCYLTYGIKPQQEAGIRLVRFRVELADRPRIDPDSERVVMTWPNTGHSAGCLRFGPDGYLYATTGDGAGPNPPDPLRTGQDLRDLLSSVLRIDVDHPDGDKLYSIPADNPFVHLQGARGEVWAYGFRNPWKFCFEPTSGALWLADVGWDTIEPVHLVEKGGNYGWSIMEGSQPLLTDHPPGPTPILPPIVEHSHLEARSLTGGEFYYGERLPKLKGALIYGDWMTGKIWGLKHDGAQVTYHQELVDSPHQVICFFVDPDGEIVILSYGGTMHRLEPNRDDGQHAAFPRRLSETGLFLSTPDHQLAPGVLPYSVIAEPWSDGTTADRFVAVPGESQLSVFEEANWEVGQVKGFLSYPHDTVLGKTVSLELETGNRASRRRIETQVLHRQGDVFNAYNYIWNDEQTDAVLGDGGGMDRQFTIIDSASSGGHRQQTWHHSSRSECLLCHVWTGGSILGFKLPQLNRGHGDVNNQLAAFDQIDLFAKPLPKEFPHQVSPHDESASLADRARAYLHINCSQCHRSEGGGLANFDARQTPSLEKTNLVNSPPMQGDFGISGSRVVVPGQPQRSLLYYRMAKMGRGHMPHLGSNVIDATGLQLIRSWIQSLGNSDDAPEIAIDQETLALIAKLQSTEEIEIEATLDQILASAEGAMLLLGSLDSQTLPPQRAEQIVRFASAHHDTRVRDLYERFVPESQRVRRLGTDFSLDELAKLSGDVRKGRQMFIESNDLACRNCHPLDGVGRNVGPDLRSVGRRYNRRQILEQIAFPSKAVDEKFQIHQVEMTDGRVVTGLLVSETEITLVLRNANGKDFSIRRDEIEYRSQHAKSLMPDQLLRDLTERQAVDLLEFLSSLKSDVVGGEIPSN
jgi:putative heme-binding domain-containing protein